MQEHFRGQLLTALCLVVPSHAGATPNWVHSSKAYTDINLHSKATVWQHLFSLPAVAAEPEAMRPLFLSESKWEHFKCPNWIFVCVFFPLPPRSHTWLFHRQRPSILSEWGELMGRGWTAWAQRLSVPPGRPGRQRRRRRKERFFSSLATVFQFCFRSFFAEIKRNGFVYGTMLI